MAITSSYQLKTFRDIQTFVANELKVQLADSESMNRIKRAINIAYLDRVAEHSEWAWLRRTIDLPFRSVQTFTGDVTANSTLVTLTVAPTQSVAGYLLSVPGTNQRLKIASHSAGAVTLQLEAPWINETSSGVAIAIWTEAVVLPVDCRAVLEVSHNTYSKPMEVVAQHRYRELVSSNPTAASDPQYYTVFDFIDPAPYSAVAGLPALSTSASTGVIRTLVFSGSVADDLFQGMRINISGSANYQFNGNFVISSVSGSTITYTGRERYNKSAAADASLSLTAANADSTDERYQQLLVYPNYINSDKVLTVEYALDLAPLIEDTDEPAMPVGDRIALAWGALGLVWSSIGRNPEEAQRCEGLFIAKLSNMASRIAATTDYPMLVPDKIYLARKRRPKTNRDRYWE